MQIGRAVGRSATERFGGTQTMDAKMISALLLTACVVPVIQVALMKIRASGAT